MTSILRITQLIFSRSILSVFAFSCLVILSSSAVGMQASEQSIELISSKLINDQNHYQISPIKCPELDQYHQASAHHCCGSTCLLKLTNNQSISTAQLSLPILAPLDLEDIGKAITRARTLFRPPIA
ncbi:hypothetical protein [Vibrio sp. VPAP30]|uniref:hypothetical protein n=1 Tax=Vibrio sp. VPAP30 TaxID=1647102 RepID=UPI0006585C9B|nr:hypothetical protein [Vibrio sp. VPAP30]KLN64695.1 hypothetical protein ZX61_12625 [Vibrio sp. VPAP30]